MDLLLVKREIEIYILKYLQKAVADNEYKYSTFGKDAEPLMALGIKNYFIKKHNFLETDFVEAPGKNDFPDLKFNTKAVEFKCAKFNKEPGNDLGTLNSWPSKIDKFNDNIYYLFVSYDEVNGQVKIENVYFDKFYKFIGVNSAGLLKYREKDGNLRPKSWSDFTTNKSYFNSLENFKKALVLTDEYRSARIVNKHIIKMNKSDLKKLYLNLHKQFKK